MTDADGLQLAQNMLSPLKLKLANSNRLDGKLKATTLQSQKPSLLAISTKLGVSCQALLFKQNSCVTIPNGSMYGTV